MSISLSSELEDRILLKVKRGPYRSPAELIQAGLDLLDASPSNIPGNSEEARPAVWQSLAALGATVSPENWSEVPSDLSKNVDAYLHGDSGSGK